MPKSEVRKESNDAYEDFMNIDPKFFYKAYIETWCKSEIIDNNICKTFNSYIRNVREKPVIEMLDYIRENLMEWMEKKVQLIKIVKDKICPRIRDKLESIRNNTRHCIANPTTRDKFQVSMFNDQFIADLHTHSCSYRW